MVIEKKHIDAHKPAEYNPRKDLKPGTLNTRLQSIDKGGCNLYYGRPQGKRPG